MGRIQNSEKETLLLSRRDPPPKPACACDLYQDYTKSRLLTRNIIRFRWFQKC